MHKVARGPRNMASLASEQAHHALPSLKKPMLPSNFPSIDIEGLGSVDDDEYSTLKRLQRHLE